jgi:hypothetical protein
MTSSFNLSFNFVTVEEEPLLHPLEASVLAALAFVILLVGLVVQVSTLLLNPLCLKSRNNAPNNEFCLFVLFTLPFSQHNTLCPGHIKRPDYNKPQEQIWEPVMVLLESQNYYRICKLIIKIASLWDSLT